MHIIRNLGTGMNGQPVAFAIIGRHGGMGLGLNLADFSAVIGAFADQRRVFKSFVDFAKVIFYMALDIVRSFLMQGGDTLCHRLVRGEIGREFGILEFNEVEGFLSGLDINGGDGGNRFATIAHPIAGNRPFGAGNWQNTKLADKISACCHSFDAR